MVTNTDVGRLEAAGGPVEAMSDRVVTALQSRIITGQIPIGTWLRHHQLADEFGISRTPVREALRILAAQGIVTIVPNRGAQVNGQSPGDIREIGEVRAELEALAAFLAADRIDDSQIARMRGAWEEFGEALKEGASPEPDLGTKWARSNDEFHTVIIEAAGNKHLVATIGELKRRMPHNLAYGAYAGNTRLLTKNLAEHEAIARAILAEDREQARELMAAHIRSSINATARWVESSTGMRSDG